MAIYAIGDVQGCYKALRKLVKTLNFKPAKDQLWLCGDLVNRGPKSADVLRYIMDLGDAAVCVLGNHDLNLLAVANDCRVTKESDTLENILNAADRDEMLNWLRTRPLFHASEKYRTCITHAGIHPSWSISKAGRLAAEVEQALAGKNYKEFLSNMYGNYPAYWDSDLKGWERLRFITNCLTRMRYLDASGALELNLNSSPSTQTTGFHPWFMHESKRKSDWTVVFGHWSTLGLHWENNALCLDSGCLWGGKLTAARIDQKKPEFYSYDCNPGS